MEYQNQYQNNYQQINSDGCLGWDDEIQRDDSFTIIPEGDYPFTVLKVERGRYNPKEGAKIPPCPQATVTFSVGGEELKENFQLHTKMEWKISALYAAVGMKEKGEKVRMNWTALPGRTGFCHVIVEKYTKNDGSTGESNKIQKFCAPWDANYAALQQQFGGAQQPAQQTTMPCYQTHAPAWQPGKF